jgi:hypothetical protein
MRYRIYVIWDASAVDFESSHTIMDGPLTLRQAYARIRMSVFAEHPEDGIEWQLLGE